MSVISVPFGLCAAQILWHDYVFPANFSGAVRIIVPALILSRMPRLNRFEDTFMNDELFFMTETGVVLVKFTLQIEIWQLVALFPLRTELIFPLAFMSRT